jgi:membrane protease YdiL (CAAX protease family)
VSRDDRRLVRSGLAGTWEIRGRNPIVGAVLLLLLLGSVYFLAQLVAQIVLFGVAAVGGEPGIYPELHQPYRPAILIIVVAGQYMVLLGGGIIGVRRWHTKRIATYLRLTHLPLGGVALAAIAAIAVLPPAGIIAQYLTDLIPGLRELAESGSFLVHASTPGELAAVLGALAVTPAICEEFVFRAYFQRTLERRVRGIWSVLIAGTLFALFHQQVLALPSLVLVGILFSYLYFAFGSPYPTVVAHLLYNGTQIVLANVSLRLPWFDVEHGFQWPAGAVGVVVLIAVVVLSERSRRLVRATARDSAG